MSGFCVLVEVNSSFVFSFLMCVVFVCAQGEYEYEFTECDSAGGRWRVPVPRKADQCLALGLASVRQRDCGRFNNLLLLVSTQRIN